MRCTVSKHETRESSKNYASRTPLEILVKCYSKDMPSDVFPRLKYSLNIIITIPNTFFVRIFFFKIVIFKFQPFQLLVVLVKIFLHVHAVAVSNDFYPITFVQILIFPPPPPPTPSGVPNAPEILSSQKSSLPYGYRLRWKVPADGENPSSTTGSDGER